MLGVFGMSRFTEDRTLDRLFSKYGRVEKLIILRDRYVCDVPHGCQHLTLALQDNSSRGFGFVTFERQADADDARVRSVATAPQTTLTVLLSGRHQWN